METGGDNRSSAGLGTGPATNIGEQELHQTSPLAEEEHVSTDNSHLEVHPSSSSSSQNPFLHPSDATNNIGNGDMNNDPSDATNNTDIGVTNNGSSSTYPVGSQEETHHSSTDDMLGLNSSFAPSTYESSPGNPFHEPTNTNNKAPVDEFDSWQKEASGCETVPTNVETHNPFQVVTEQGHEGMASSNLVTSFSEASESSSQEHIHVTVNADNKSMTDTNAPSELGLDSHIAAECSDDDIPISSMPKHGQSGDVAGQHSATVEPGSNWELGTKKGSEIQNPPVQVMERPGESDTSSQYVFPSHVFARNNTNSPVEWSTASNESLFSIYMGNTSFSSELTCFGKYEHGDTNMPDPPNASPYHQPPTPVNKFNDISQRTAELHEQGSKETEAKAAETMREVIMESSRTTENKGERDNRRTNSHRQSDGSTQSYAFQSSTDGDKSVSNRGAKQKQQKQTEQKVTTNAVDQAPNSTTNAPPNRWLSCFSCCTFCH